MACRAVASGYKQQRIGGIIAHTRLINWGTIDEIRDRREFKPNRFYSYVLFIPHNAHVLEHAGQLGLIRQTAYHMVFLDTNDQIRSQWLQLFIR